MFAPPERQSNLPKRQPQEHFTKQLQPFRPGCHVERLLFWNIPVVFTRSFHHTIAMPSQMTMHVEPQQVIFHQQHRRAVPSQIETTQDLQFQTFNINGQKINLGIARLRQDFIQRSHFHFFHPVKDNAIVQIQPGQAVIARRHVQLRPAALLRRTEGALENPAAGTLLAQ